jgi:hypothetical protein
MTKFYREWKAPDPAKLEEKRLRRQAVDHFRETRDEAGLKAYVLSQRPDIPEEEMAIVLKYFRDQIGANHPLRIFASQEHPHQEVLPQEIDDAITGRAL